MIFVVACRLTFQQRPGRILLALSGEVDLSAGGHLRDALDWALTSGVGDIEVDLHAVTFLDCTAIGVIVAGHTAAQQAGRGLFLSHPPRFVRTMLELTGDLDHLTAADPSRGLPSGCPRPTLGSDPRGLSEGHGTVDDRAGQVHSRR